MAVVIEIFTENFDKEIHLSPIANRTDKVNYRNMLRNNKNYVITLDSFKYIKFE